MKNFTKTLTGFFLLGLSFVVISYSSGPPTGKAGDPGQGNCTSCHSGTVNSGGGNLSDLLLNGNFFKGGYIPDSTYNISIAFKHSGISKFGFETTALVSSNNNPAGTLTKVGTKTQKKSLIVSGKTRQYIQHTSSGTTKTSTDSIFWKFKWKAPSTNVGTVKFYVAVNATNGNGMTSGDKVYTKVFSINVTGVPVAKATTPNNNVCLMDSVQFTGSATENPTKWAWTFTGSATTTSTLQNPKIKFNGTGSHTATLVASNAKGSSVPEVLKINISSPSSRIYGNDTNYYCSGDSILLKSSFTKNASYLWSPFGEKTQNIMVKKPENYQVTVTDTLSNCSVKSNIVVIIENPTIKATLGADKTGNICSDQEITFTATPNTADSFYFYLNTILVSSQVSPIYKRKLAHSSKLWVDIKIANSCSKISDTLEIKIAPKANKPIPTCGKTTPSKITIYWNKVKYATGYKIRKGTDAWINLTNIDTSYTYSGLDGNTNYKFEVTSTSLSPCAASEAGKVTCKTEKCNTTFTLTAPTEICPNSDAKIELSNISAANYEIKIDGKKAQLVNTFKPTSTTTYVISVSDLDNPKCLTTDSSHTIKIKKIGVLNVIYTPKDSVCFGKKVLLTSKLPRTNYEIFKDGIKVGMTHSNLFTGVSVAGSGIHKIHVTATENGCNVTSDTKTITFLPQTLISFTKSRSHKTYTFTPDNTSLKSYAWFKDGKQFSTDKIAKIDLTDDEKEVDIKLIIIDENNCDFSTVQKFTTPKFSSLDINNPFKISVYPNPSSGFVNIDLSKAETGVYTLKIFDVSGKLVISKFILKSEKITLHKAGVYFVELINSKGEKSRVHLVVQ